MSEKISLRTIASLTNESSALAALNSNFATIRAALLDVLSRDGTSPNAMRSTLDMDSNRIINLPGPIRGNEPLRLVDLQDFLDEGLIIGVEPADAPVTDEGIVVFDGTSGDIIKDSQVVISDHPTNAASPLASLSQGAEVPRVDQGVYWKSPAFYWEGNIVNSDWFAGPNQMIVQSRAMEVFGQAQTTLSANAAAGASTVTLTSVSGFTDRKTIGIVLDDGTAHITYINGAPAGNVVTLGANLPSAASSGNRAATSQTTVISSSALAGATTISVRNKAAAANGDVIRIELDDGTTDLRTVDSATDTSITLTSGLSGPAAAGNYVLVGTYDVSPDLILSHFAPRGAEGDFLPNLAWTGPNDAMATPGVNVLYMQLFGVVNDASAGNETVTMHFNTVVTGSLTTPLKIGSGVYTGGNSDKGFNTINAEELWVSDTERMLVSGSNFIISSGASNNIQLLPATGLAMVAAASGTAQFRIAAPASTANAILEFNDGALRWQVYKPASSTNLRFHDGTADRLTLHNGGNVTIETGGLRVGFTGDATAADLVEVGDSLFSMDYNAGVPKIVWDTNDLMFYDRTSNAWTFTIGSTNKLILTSSAFTPGVNDGVLLGTGSVSWADLFLATGGTISWNNGNYTLTHSSGLLTASGPMVIGTSATTPLVIGGTGASSSLTIQSTSGVGTSDTIVFKTGNNGAVTALTIGTSGVFGFGATPSVSEKVLIETNGTSVNQLKVRHTGTTGTIISATTGGAFLFNNQDNANIQFAINNGGHNMYLLTDGSLGVDTNAAGGSGGITGLGKFNARSGTATPAAASAVAAFQMGSALVGIYWGTGTPNAVVTAPKGSLYIRTDGSTTSTRLYVNTDAGTTWTNVTTAA